MRIRTFLVAAFLIATLTPAAIFGWLSYQTNATREFDQVSERHLLHAKNAGMALERYHTDVVATFVSISDSLILGNTTPNLEALMKSINMACVLIVDPQSGRVKARTEVEPNGLSDVVPPAFLKIARQIADTEEKV